MLVGQDLALLPSVVQYCAAKKQCVPNNTICVRGKYVHIFLYTHKMSERAHRKRVTFVLTQQQRLGAWDMGEVTFFTVYYFVHLNFEPSEGI